MTEIYATAYFLLSLSMGWILFGFIKRSQFGVLIGYTEMFVFFGAFVYPVLFYADLVQPAQEGQGFLFTTGEPGLSTMLHVAGYLFGATMGLVLASRVTHEQHSFKALSFAKSLIADERKFFKRALITGIGFLFLYLTILGWDTAIAYALLMRGGDFDGIQREDQYFLFLKSLAFTFTFIVCFVPSMLRGEISKTWILLYVFFVALLYLVSISRMVVLLNIVVPLLFYIRGRTKEIGKFVFLISSAMPIIVLFLYYGKPLGFVIYKWIIDGELVDLEPFLSEYGLFSAFFGNFEFGWFSIEAGMRNFFSTSEPFISLDIPLSMVGFIPSRVLDYLGLTNWDYRLAQPLMSCVNTRFFGFECTIPPRELGLTAYVFPIGGAFLVGFIKFFIFRRQEKFFIYMENVDYRKSWYPLLVIVLLGMFFSFIPTVISQLVFLLLLLASGYGTLRAMQAIRGRIGPAF